MDNIKACIFLLEDDQIQLEAIREAINICLPNCVVRFATNGKELLRMLTSEPPPDILILDINVPMLSGWEVLKKIRERSELDRLPVVMFSTDDSMSTRLKARELKATAIVTKPVGLASSDQMGIALVDIVRKYSVPNAVPGPITKPFLQESSPFLTGQKTVDELMGEL